MIRPPNLIPPFCAALGVLLSLTVPAPTTLFAQTDLDAFMQQVLARRDDNWTKLQQFVLDEHEELDVRGPAHAALWGERRDYTWFIQDGFFVRSPLKYNGVAIGERDRREYEADFLRREQQREKRRTERAQARAPDAVEVPDTVDQGPRDIESLLKQTRQPQFISSAYFLRFKFDEGRYALVGREQLEGQEVLRIEYYPSLLFSNGRDRQRRAERGDQKDNTAYERQMQRLMNKSSLVTLWVVPSSHQIIKYTFDNLPWDFLPGQWLVRVTDVTASMTMGQPFPDVWLPRGLDVHVGMAMAAGDIDVRYALDYHDYRRADVTSKVGIPGVR